MFWAVDGGAPFGDVNADLSSCQEFDRTVDDDCYKVFFPALPSGLSAGAVALDLDLE